MSWSLKELLDYPDNDLLDLVMHRAPSISRRLQPLLELMRMQA